MGFDTLLNMTFDTNVHNQTKSKKIYEVALFSLLLFTLYEDAFNDIRNWCDQ